jgi:basic membrane protein A
MESYLSSVSFTTTQQLRRSLMFKRATLIVGLLLLAGLLLVACSGAAAPEEATEEPTEEAMAEEPTEAPMEETVEAPTEEPAGENYIWAMVTDQHGLGDQGFNDLAYAGMTRIVDTYGGEIKVIESTEQAQYVPNFSQLAEAGDVTLIAGIGFLLIDVMNEVAPQYPDQKFALIDAVVDQPNVASLVFRENEGAYLAGIITGLTTKSNIVGFAGGMETPPVIRFQAGYMAGIRSVNPDAEILVSYIGSFGDPARGKEVTQTLYDQGADIVFEVGGGSGLGAWEAAAERGEGVKIFGTDTCKNQLSPPNALPDVTKGVDSALFLTAGRVVDGTFEGGTQSFGLAEDGVGLCQETYPDVPEDIRAVVETAREMIINGDLVVPATLEELDAFEPPVLQ